MSNDVLEKNNIIQLQGAEDKKQKLLELLNVEKAKLLEYQKVATIRKESMDKYKQEYQIFLDELNNQSLLMAPNFASALNSIRKVKKEGLDQILCIKNYSKPVEVVLESLLIFELGHSWRTKEFLVKDASDGRNPYNIREALIKKLNLKDTKGFLLQLENLCTEENLKIFKSNHLENMKLLEDFIQKYGVTPEYCRRGAYDLIGLLEYMQTMLKLVQDYVNKVDPITEKLESIEAELQLAVELKEKAFAELTLAEEIVKDIHNQIEEIEKNLQAQP